MSDQARHLGHERPARRPRRLRARRARRARGGGSSSVISTAASSAGAASVAAAGGRPAAGHGPPAGAAASLAREPDGDGARRGGAAREPEPPRRAAPLAAWASPAVARARRSACRRWSCSSPVVAGGYLLRGRRRTDRAPVPRRRPPCRRGLGDAGAQRRLGDPARARDAEARPRARSTRPGSSGPRDGASSAVRAARDGSAERSDPGPLEGAETPCGDREPRGGSTAPTSAPVLEASAEAGARAPLRTAQALARLRRRGRLLSPSRPRDERLVLELRATDLPGLHDLHARSGCAARNARGDRPRCGAARRAWAGATRPRRYAIIALIASPRLRRRAGRWRARRLAAAGPVIRDGGLFGPAVADGELVGSSPRRFLHAGILHLRSTCSCSTSSAACSSRRSGPPRFVGIYFGLAARRVARRPACDPDEVTVGASGGDLRADGRRRS